LVNRERFFLYAKVVVLFVGIACIVVSGAWRILYNPLLLILIFGGAFAPRLATPFWGSMCTVRLPVWTFILGSLILLWGFSHKRRYVLILASFYALLIMMGLFLIDYIGTHVH